MSDPKKGGKYIVATSPQKNFAGSKKGTEVHKPAVDSAKAGTGPFRPMKYQGSISKAGFKSASGKFSPSTGPVSAAANKKAYNYERKVFKSDSTFNADRTNRFKHAKKI